MSSFYRYLRPWSYNFNRRLIEVCPLGGVCFRIDELVKSTLMISFSICRDDEVFSKEVAKKITDGRAQEKFFAVQRAGTSIGGFDTNSIAWAFIEQLNADKALSQQITEANPAWSEVAKLYMEHELELLRSKILAIWANHRAMKELSELDKETIEALGLRKQYEVRSRA